MDTEEQKNVKAVEITPASVKSTAIQTDPIDEVDNDETTKPKKTHNPLYLLPGLLDTLGRLKDVIVCFELLSASL